MEDYLRANNLLSIFCKNYMELKKGLPIRPSEMEVLNLITGTKDPHTPAMLAEKLGVSKPMITAHITSLEQEGYVTKAPSARDKRAYYIQPTRKALELVERARLELNDKLAYLENELGQSYFRALVILAEKAGAILEGHGT